jgi:hypothetical protein
MALRQHPEQATSIAPIGRWPFEVSASPKRHAASPLCAQFEAKKAKTRPQNFLRRASADFLF